jgi:hypothetical protein
VAAWFLDTFCNFHLVKIHKNDKNSTATEAREKISTDLESSKCLECFDTWLTKFRNNDLINKQQMS